MVAAASAALDQAPAVLLFIFYIQPDASDLAPHRTKLDQLMGARDTIYDNLRDLRFEYLDTAVGTGLDALKERLFRLVRLNRSL
jgi:hypothetical protein